MIQNRTRSLLSLLAMSMFAAWVNGQSVESRRIEVPRGGTLELGAVREDYFPSLIRVEAPVPGGNSERAWLAAEKARLNKLRREPQGALAKVDTVAPAPWVGVNFQSNQVIDGVPNDNDMAISNAGMIISVINSNIYVHQPGGALATSLSLDAWAAPLGVSAFKFDPRALYDPNHDRFIISCLAGFTDSTSVLIVGFSQTNDPSGTWSLYALPGDPNNDSLWTDYPIMALNANELFITGNLLYNDQPWQTGFNQSICWQIDLDSAYAGGSLQTRLWFNPQFGGAPIRNLCPIQGGSMPGGNNLYLLSNRNFATGNDTVFIMEITDSMNAPGAQFLVDYGISNTQYALAPNAMQQFNQQLATNDARWLDGFVENGVVQFVGNCRDTTTGRAGFYHGMITDITGARTVTGTVIGNPNGDYGYPGIAWMGMTPTSNEALLAINYCGTTAATRPGCGAIYTDGNGNYSPLVISRTGASYINALSGVDRWGDYTGAQRKYDTQGVVWMSATFGRLNQTPGTWVSEFFHPSIVGVAPAPEAVEVTAFPNPTADLVTLKFELTAAEFLDISIWDMSGRRVKTLVRDLVRAGVHQLTFSTDPLAAGTYMLRIEGSEHVIATRSIVKTH